MALVILGLIGIDAFFVSVALYTGLEFWLGDAMALRGHVLWGLFGILFTCFIHCMSMFYLVGTGKDLADAMRDHPDLNERYLQEIRDFKWEVHPFATFAAILMIAVGALGAAVQTGYLPRWLHFTSVLVALAFNAVAFFKEFGVVHRNRRIIAEVDKALYERGVRA